MPEGLQGQAGVFDTETITMGKDKGVGRAWFHERARRVIAAQRFAQLTGVVARLKGWTSQTTTGAVRPSVEKAVRRVYAADDVKP